MIAHKAMYFSLQWKLRLNMDFKEIIFVSQNSLRFWINKVHLIVGTHSFRNSTNSFFILFCVQSEKHELMSIRQWSLNKITARKHGKVEWCVSLHQKAMLTRKITRILETVYAVLCTTCHCSIKYNQLTEYLTNYWKIWIILMVLQIRG